MAKDMRLAIASVTNVARCGLTTCPSHKKDKGLEDEHADPFSSDPVKLLEIGHRQGKKQVVVSLTCNS
ncbi:hypothetical protein VNO80_23115 [Phaseolus coccineus]|uniref:Uncharacterized protein n=1 Tax=Phaseolus coccineus TaxID=3886 RepID=A0AAN9QUP4_PHACN